MFTSVFVLLLASYCNITGKYKELYYLYGLCCVIVHSLLIFYLFKRLLVILFPSFLIFYVMLFKLTSFNH